MSKKPRGHVSVSAPTFESIRREARRRGVPLVDLRNRADAAILSWAIGNMVRK